MKKMFQVFALAGLVLMGVAASASAQTASSSMKVRVGFDFNVGNQQLPAGEYRIKTLNNSPSQQLIQVESVDGRVQAIVGSIPNPGSGRLAVGEVQFNRYGDKYFLSSVRVGDDFIHEVLKSRAERQVTGNVSLQQKHVTLPATIQ